MDKYQIEVSMTPDEGHPHKPFFWCILKLKGTNWINSGFGWSVDPQQAWVDANINYQSNCKI